jgi:hypothetical protein
VTLSLLLGYVAIGIPAVAYDATQGEGAFVGIALLDLLLAAGSYIAWPRAPETTELRHRELEAIWREIRADADAEVPWSRYGAWAVADGDRVRLELIRHAGTPCEQPSPFSRERAGRHPGEDAEGAVAAMEALRARAAAAEEAARQAHIEAQARERDRHDDDALKSVEDKARAYAKAADEQMREELARQARADREAEADALARALRRP